MSRLIVLSLGQGNLRDGFATVTAHLGEADYLYRMKFTASLPGAPNIIELYKNWRSLYFAFYQRLSWRHGVEDDDFEIEESSITNVSEIDIGVLCQSFSKQINEWLNSTEFRKIDQQLRTQFKPSEEIRFVIETNDNLVRRLPWHLWELFEDYSHAEIALSSTEYQQPNKFLATRPRNYIKILAILGNSQGINISRDREFLENLSNQAEIQFLVEPDLTQVNEQLWQQSWDILFFAGHSCSQQSCSQEKGLLQINKTDTIALEQLKYALKQAINRGLQLAIFNSCDGLGLAQQLQDLHIPQVIVMREPVPDVIAQEFLKNFLAEFSGGKPLYRAVRSARERLQALEKEHPCASWLPVIFQNPAEPPMIWSSQGSWDAWEDKIASNKAATFSINIGVPTELRSPSVKKVFSTTSVFDTLIEKVNRKLLETQNDILNYAESVALQGIWQHQSFNQIAEHTSYSPGYLTNVVAPGLYQKLSDLIGKRVTKKNCRSLLEYYVITDASPKITKPTQLPKNLFSNPKQEVSPFYPSGSVPVDSPYYIPHSALETQVYQEITNPGALIRIKAPQEMGKTSLLLRILEYANQIGYQTVSLNLQEQVDQSILSDFNRFLRWLCANISRQLQLEPRLDECWDDDIGCKVSCSSYLRNYILPQLDSPLVLALDEVNQIFEHPQVAKEFLPLLRSWYEEGKRRPIWQKLRLVVVHSTEVYVPLQLHQSPFNVGLPIQLTCFSHEQVHQLAQCYGLGWEDTEEARLLMDMVGGHPALVHLALYYLSRGEFTLTQLLQNAPTPTGIYYNHLQRHWKTLQGNTELASAVNMVMNATEPVHLESVVAHKLNSMGLIKLDKNQAIPSCQLYRQYFQLQQSQEVSPELKFGLKA
ncbi:MAG: AAA-like domain-containing protein [Scytonema sp. PMC 1069.18]|nr:AAA-like domain-containing protein [Scytonema sp. PMC 1069.18]MEC4884777.1 AAA-like domain-containing protein [Scytonema sp. PMC 1070.18]